MAKRLLPDADYLRKLLHYEPTTGVLSWRLRPDEMFISPAKAAWWNRTFAGEPALCSVNPLGYLGGTIEQRGFLAHRIIWKWFYGADPDVIDHINGDRADNRISNLRSVGRAENNRNQRLFKSNTSGAPGVRFEKGAWVVRIRANGRHAYLGRFQSLDDAIATRKAAEAGLGYHPNHGRNLT